MHREMALNFANTPFSHPPLSCPDFLLRQTPAGRIIPFVSADYRQPAISGSGGTTKELAQPSPDDNIGHKGRP